MRRGFLPGGSPAPASATAAGARAAAPAASARAQPSAAPAAAQPPQQTPLLSAEALRQSWQQCLELLRSDIDEKK
jgi:hypothetical protein